MNTARLGTSQPLAPLNPTKADCPSTAALPVDVSLSLTNPVAECMPAASPSNQRVAHP